MDRVIPSDPGERSAFLDAFWSHVDKSGDGCWIFNGSRSQTGYGRFRKKAAHRISWEAHFGEVPDGLLICHHCDNPSCVRPNHLFAGTAFNNTRDWISKGHDRKLTPREKVIGAMIVEGMSNPEIAEKLESSVHTVASHRARMFSKLGVNSAAAFAIAFTRYMEQNP